MTFDRFSVDARRSFDHESAEAPKDFESDQSVSFYGQPFDQNVGRALMVELSDGVWNVASNALGGRRIAERLFEGIEPRLAQRYDRLPDQLASGAITQASDEIGDQFFVTDLPHRLGERAHELGVVLFAVT